MAVPVTKARSTFVTLAVNVVMPALPLSVTPGKLAFLFCIQRPYFITVFVQEYPVVRKVSMLFFTFLARRRAPL